MSEYTTTIGLEIHAELKTQSKMFCGCKNDPDEKRPNVNVCPICMGHPGTLPVINKEAVRKVLQVGAAIGAQLADFTEFDRKNYFYPDIPKDYQISQYKYPLVSGGELAGVTITRVHLEEDTARSSHETPDVSLVDFNRAGVPLMELVTEPVITSAEQAMKFGRELQLLLQYLGVSEANMEKGEMRVEVNMSVSKDEKLGTKVEVKNINSFKAAGRAIEYEFKRQTGLLDKGDKVVQETRGFDENKGTTFSQRSKEDSHDYRYFPDPDLPKLKLSELAEFSKGAIEKSLAETPIQKRARYANDYGLKVDDIEVYVNQRELGSFFESTAALLENDVQAIKILSNYITSDLAGLLKNNSSSNVTEGLKMLTIESMSRLVHMIIKGEISSRGAKETLKIMFEKGGDAETIAKENNLIQKNDPEEIKRVMQIIISENTKKIAEYKSGKESLLQFFIGQGMKAMQGAGNPEKIKEVFTDLVK
jgi:aspartyl-tRNA(Asn)/glutamyl-tRNA(Gln) amidotransferase subunit B